MSDALGWCICPRFEIKSDCPVHGTAAKQKRSEIPENPPPPKMLSTRPTCGAELPGERGPMCCLDPGHKGFHVSTSGLFRWGNEEDKA